MGTSVASACINDSDSEDFELEAHQILELSEEPVLNLITGQFPHHSQAYWRQRVAQSQAHLALVQNNVTLLNDSAVGLLKQGRYDDAAAQLARILNTHPNYYPALSNLGVLEKKRGNYAQAARWLRRALGVKPGGHMGLGDFYLRMCRWKAANRDRVPTHNFLGRPYQSVSIARRERGRQTERRHLETLIQNDRAFPDVYLVLGDHLRQDGRPHLALWSYLRARQLGHPASAALNTRIAGAHSAFRARIDDLTGRRVPARGTVVRRIEHRLEAAQGWVARFETAEADLIESGRHPRFADVEALLNDRGVVRVGPKTPLLRRSSSK
jgi:tetratricopeptide (TPR) repeat protein